MPVHDWTRVTPNIFHDFHCSWVPRIKEALNSGILPSEYYALAEQTTADVKPDVVTLELSASDGPGLDRHGPGNGNGGVAVALPPPKTSITARAEGVNYARLRRTIAIRHSADHAVVALIEVLSHANRASRYELDAFLNKAQSALKENIHLLLVDLYPPGRLDPAGIHGALWEALGQPPFRLPIGKPLTAASYEAGDVINAYVEPLAVGQALPLMPVFLRPSFYVNVPLEETYNAAYRGVPAFWRERIEKGATA